MFSVFLQADQELFLFLNGLHSPFLDQLMGLITGRETWIPLYVTMLGGLIYHYKWKAVPVILAIVICITLADQISSSLFKPTFGRLRPCHNPLIESEVHLVKGCGGMYGFVSSHAANTFGLATLIWLLFRRRYAWVWWLFVWSALVCYSRIYVGVHYPLDVLGGCLVGALSAMFSYRLYVSVGGRFQWLKEEDIRLKARGWVEQI